MRISSGKREHLTIDGVFDGLAGVSGAFVTFLPTDRPPAMTGGILAGVPVLLWPAKDAAGPFWTARYEVAR